MQFVEGIVDKTFTFESKFLPFKNDVGIDTILHKVVILATDHLFSLSAKGMSTDEKGHKY